MKTTFKTRLTAFAILVTLSLNAQVKAAEDTSKPAEADPKTVAEMLDNPQPFEITFGDPKAKVRMVEYASLSCSHCKSFHDEIFSKLKPLFIDNNKISFIYRHFPLNQPAFRAAQLVECVGDNERKKVFLNALFKSQPDWAYEKTEPAFMEKLKQIAKIGGVGDEQFTICLQNKDLEDKLLAAQLKAAQDLKIAGTPAVFLNGKLLAPEDKDATKLQAQIDKLLAEK